MAIKMPNLNCAAPATVEFFRHHTATGWFLLSQQKPLGRRWVSYKTLARIPANKVTTAARMRGSGRITQTLAGKLVGVFVS
jgi:hypothetical protein